jgi:hypothetical protein
MDRLHTNNLKFVSHQRQTALNSVLSFILSWIRLSVFTSLHFLPVTPPLLSQSLPFTFPNSFHCLILCVFFVFTLFPQFLIFFNSYLFYFPLFSFLFVLLFLFRMFSSLFYIFPFNIIYLFSFLTSFCVFIFITLYKFSEQLLILLAETLV